MELEIAQTWDGRPIQPSERTRLALEWEHRDLRVHVDATFFGDPPPAAPPGPTWALWEHEVVELFVLGSGERYTEIELGPHGHHLVLRLEGRRNITDKLHPIAFEAHVEGDRWSGSALVPGTLLPPTPHALNAYSVHGLGPERRHLAWQAVPGPRPDFHRLERFIKV